MTEKELENKTGSILAAYIKLADLHYAPSLAEYLTLRRYAVEELKMGILSESRKTEPASAAREVQIPPSEVPKTSVNKVKKNETVPVLNTVKESIETAPRRDYDILKDLEDPWN